LRWSSLAGESKNKIIRKKKEKIKPPARKLLL
jgi:hypothetical protein